MTIVRAAGTVLWRNGATGLEVAVVHRPRYDDWSFPKGKLGRGESLVACAARETAEETGFTARLGARLGLVRYTVPEGPKEVHYWAAAAGEGGSFTANDESDELRFLDVDKAAALLSYRHDLDVLRRFTALGPPTSTVLLVRHAKAGNRADWTTDDHLRPLSGTGRGQAARIAAFLPLFRPDRLSTAPPVRCRDTFTPFVDATATPTPTIEPLLGEERYGADPEAGLARFRELAAVPGVTAICSQGGVIPDVVGALAKESDRKLGVDPADVPSHKGSTWVLSFAGPVLRAADYYATPAG